MPWIVAAAGVSRAGSKSVVESVGLVGLRVPAPPAAPAPTPVGLVAVERDHQLVRSTRGRRVERQERLDGTRRSRPAPSPCRDGGRPHTLAAWTVKRTFGTPAI